MIIKVEFQKQLFTHASMIREETKDICCFRINEKLPNSKKL